MLTNDIISFKQPGPVINVQSLSRSSNLDLASILIRVIFRLREGLLDHQ